MALPSLWIQDARASHPPTFTDPTAVLSDMVSVAPPSSHAGWQPVRCHPGNRWMVIHPCVWGPPTRIRSLGEGGGLPRERASACPSATHLALLRRIGTQGFGSVLSPCRPSLVSSGSLFTAPWLTMQTACPFTNSVSCPYRLRRPVYRRGLPWTHILSPSTWMQTRTTPPLPHTCVCDVARVHRPSPPPYPRTQEEEGWWLMMMLLVTIPIPTITAKNRCLHQTVTQNRPFLCVSVLVLARPSWTPFDLNSFLLALGGPHVHGSHTHTHKPCLRQPTTDDSVWVPDCATACRIYLWVSPCCCRQTVKPMVLSLFMWCLFVTFCNSPTTDTHTQKKVTCPLNATVSCCLYRAGDGWLLQREKKGRSIHDHP